MLTRFTIKNLTKLSSQNSKYLKSCSIPNFYTRKNESKRFFCTEEKKSTGKSDLKEKIRESNRQQLKDEIDFDIKNSNLNSYSTQSVSTGKLLFAGSFKKNFNYAKYFLLFFGAGWLLLYGMDYRENPLKQSTELTFIKKSEEKFISDMFVYFIADEFSKNIMNWDKEEKNIKFLEENFLESFELAANKYCPIEDLSLVVLDTNVPILQLLNNNH